MLTPRRADIPGILIGAALIGLVLVGFIWRGQQFHSIDGSDLACLDMPKSGGPLCVRKPPTRPAPRHGV